METKRNFVTSIAWFVLKYMFFPTSRYFFVLEKDNQCKLNARYVVFAIILLKILNLSKINFTFHFC